MNNKKITAMKANYEVAKAANIGESCTCPSCGTQFVKGYKQQAFCTTKGKTKCKDKYWNNVTPEKRCNTTRISPANAAWGGGRIWYNAPDGRGFDPDDAKPQ
jgi:hypothetical protein